MADDDRAALENVVVHLGFRDQFWPRRHRRHGKTTSAGYASGWLRIVPRSVHRLQRQHIGTERPGDLLGLSVVIAGKEAAIEDIAEFRDPGQMEIVPGSSGDAGPIVNRHGTIPSKGDRRGGLHSTRQGRAAARRLSQRAPGDIPPVAGESLVRAPSESLTGRGVSVIAASPGK